MNLTSSFFEPQKIIEGRQPIILVGRRKDINIHLQELRDEFIGKPEVCFQIAKCIVCIRREDNLEENLSEFYRLLTTHNDILLCNLSTRWLISICDTISDHGKSIEKGNAMIISTLVNMIKLADTCLILVKNSNFDEKKIREQLAGTHLWDGLTEFHVMGGDMVRNLFDRIQQCVGETPLIADIWNEVLVRIKLNDCMISRLSKLHAQQGFYK